MAWYVPPGSIGQPKEEPEEPPSATETLLTQDMKIHVWRARELMNMGFDPDFADLMAGDKKIDLHDVLRMLRDGCTFDQAVDLLL